MKAKIYYIHPEAIANLVAPAKRRGEPYSIELWSRKDYPYMGVNVPYLVIEPSSMDQVIERAARVLYAREHSPITPALKWSTRGEEVRAKYRAQARAAYRAGGFVK